MKIGNLEVYGVIYKITNKINGKVYIGQTIQSNGFDDRYKYNAVCDIEKVYRYYQNRKDWSKYWNKHLVYAIEKYGFDAFEVDKVFDVAFSKEELNVKEQSWILIYDSYNNGYNNDGGGSTRRKFKVT